MDEELMYPNQKAEKLVDLINKWTPHAPCDTGDLSEALYILQEGGFTDVSEHDALMLWKLVEYLRWNAVPRELIL